MTDTDIDIDPTLDAHLRRTFREVAAAVTEADALGRVVRLVTAPAPNPPRRRWAWLGAAAAAGVVAGAGLMAVADRDSDQAAVPTASTVPVVDPDLEELGAQCLAAMETARSGLPPEVRVDERMLPALEGATVALFDGGADLPYRELLIADAAGTFVTCRILDGSNHAIAWNPNVIVTEFSAPVHSAHVRVVYETSHTGSDPILGPGSVFVVGRAAADVNAIAIELSDGTTVAGDIQLGWFVIDAPVPSGVSTLDTRLVFATADGEISMRTDLLDLPDDNEQCAATTECVETRLNELLTEASELGRIEQAAALSDLVVTNGERDEAQQRFADCFNAADTGATATAHGNGMLAFGTSGLDEADRDLVDDVHALCAAAHTDLVEEAYALLDAQRRVAEG